jgi:protein-disulfide isomerase
MNPSPTFALTRLPRRIPLLLGSLALVASLPACAAEASSSAAAPAAASGGSEPVAEVAGKTITMSDLEQKLAPQLANLDRQRRKILEDGIDDVVNDSLFEAEAAARKISVEELRKQEIDAKITPPDDAAVSAFYEENKARIKQPLEQIAPRIKDYLSNQQRAGLENALLEKLRDKYQPKILLEPTRADVSIAGAPAKGPDNAPVTIVEFSDFQCPFCSRVEPTIAEALKVYGDQIKFVFRQFPLTSIHPFAQKAAEASLCADEQGKFWALHDAMFGNQSKLGVPDLKSTAAELGLNADQFNACLDDGKYAKKIAADVADGSRAGVNGTPAMFVNGRFLSGAVPFEQLSQLIDDELRRKGITPKKSEG